METKTLDDRGGRLDGTSGCWPSKADKEDLALAKQALEAYGAEGIEGTTPYSEYRAKRLGASVS